MKKKFNYLNIFFIICLFLGVTAVSFAQQQTPEKKILFVGNSFTYFWNMPNLVEAMAASQNVKLNTSQSTVGGSTLQQHWNKEKGTDTRNLLEKNTYDYVVLQDHSLSTIDHLERFRESTKNLIELVRSKEATPVLYMTWAYDSNPLMQRNIEKAYNEQGKATNTAVIPVGNVFMKAQKERQDLDYYFDNKHPSSIGSYLIALVFYKYFSGKSVMDIPNRLTSVNDQGEQIYLCFILPETGDFLRQLVEEYDMDPLKTVE